MSAVSFLNHKTRSATQGAKFVNDQLGWVLVFEDVYCVHHFYANSDFN